MTSVLCVALVVSCVLYEQECDQLLDTRPIEWAAPPGPQATDDKLGAPQLIASLSTGKVRIHRRERIQIEVRVTNRSDRGISVFNPFFNRLAGRQPVVLAVFDANGVFRRDLLGPQVGSQVTYIEAFFETLPAGGISGAEVKVPIDLPPGIYTVQAIYRDFFISEDPVRSDTTLIEMRQQGAERRAIERHKAQLRGAWWKRYRGREVFRSNAVQVIVVDPNESPELT